MAFDRIRLEKVQDEDEGEGFVIVQTDTTHLKPGEPFMHASDLLTKEEALAELHRMGQSNQTIAALFSQAEAATE